MLYTMTCVRVRGRRAAENHQQKSRWLADWRTANALAEVTRSFPDPAAIAWAGVDVDRFLALTQFHRVGIFLGQSLAADTAVPSSVANFSKMVGLRHAFMSARMWSDLPLVADVIARLRGPCLVMKGPALSQLVYAGAPRESSDIDLLMNRSEFVDAIALFEEAGCVVQLVDWNFMSRIASGEIGIRTPSGLQVDLHWHPVHSGRVRQQFDIKTEDWVDRAVSLTVRRPNDDRALVAHTLDPTDTINHLCLHACLSGAERILWFKDIDLAVRRLAWRSADLIARTAANGTGPLVATMLSRANAVMGTPVDRALLRELGGSRLLPAVCSHLFDRYAPPHRQRRVGPDRSLYRSMRATTQDSVAELGRNAASRLFTRADQDLVRPWRSLDLDQGSNAERRGEYLRSISAAT